MKFVKSVILVLVLLTALFIPAMLSAQSYSQQATLAADPAFIERVKVAIVLRAVLISHDETPQTSNFANRVRLANQVVLSPSSFATQFAVAVVTNTAIRSTSTDVQIDQEVASAWNVFAGISLQQ